MPSFKVLQKEEAEKVAVTFTPQKFPMRISEAAQSFVNLQAQSEKPSFHIDRIVAVQTGVEHLERLSMQERVEKEALERLKELQEDAYREAYQLGLDEGREQSFNEFRSLFEERLGQLDQLLHSIENLKTDLVNFNEAHIVKLIYYMASRIAMDEIQERPEIILPIIKKAIGSTQVDDSVTISVSQSDYEFIQSVKDRLGKDMDFIKRVKLVESDTVKPGGCVIETNFGVVDASLEKRMEKLWESLEAKIPRVKQVIGE